MADSPLYRDLQMGSVECLGCTEVMEIPYAAVLRAGGRREQVRNNPENLAAWMELQELDHRQCLNFADVEKAKQARQYRKEGARRKLIGLDGGRRDTARSSKSLFGSASGGGGTLRG